MNLIQEYLRFIQVLGCRYSIHYFPALREKWFDSNIAENQLFQLLPKYLNKKEFLKMVLLKPAYVDSKDRNHFAFSIGSIDLFWNRVIEERNGNIRIENNLCSKDFVNMQEWQVNLYKIFKQPANNKKMIALIKRGSLIPIQFLDNDAHYCLLRQEETPVDFRSVVTQLGGTKRPHITHPIEFTLPLR